MGKKVEALDWLEKALIENLSDLPRINNYIIFNDLHSEPSFDAILEKIGLKEYKKRNELLSCLIDKYYRGGHYVRILYIVFEIRCCWLFS